MVFLRGILLGCAIISFYTGLYYVIHDKYNIWDNIENSGFISLCAFITGWQIESYRHIVGQTKDEK